MKYRIQIYAVFLACKHPGTPWYAKALAVCVVAYALSPIDLIPDFIPVLGYLDDLILVPLGVALVVRLVPKRIMEECRVRARDQIEQRAPYGWAAAAVIILIWVALAGLCGWLVWRWWHTGAGVAASLLIPAKLAAPHKE